MTHINNFVILKIVYRSTRTSISLTCGNKSLIDYFDMLNPVLNFLQNLSLYKIEPFTHKLDQKVFGIWYSLWHVNYMLWILHIYEFGKQVLKKYILYISHVILLQYWAISVWFFFQKLWRLGYIMKEKLHKINRRVNTGRFVKSAW